MNKVILIGNVGREPEMCFIPNGQPVTDFSLAVSRKYNEENFTEWFKVTAWGKLAETTNQYVTKGMKVMVEGRIELEEWDSDDGKRSQMKVTASNVEFLSKSDKPQEEATTETDEIDPNDIPF